MGNQFWDTFENYYKKAYFWLIIREWTNLNKLASFCNLPNLYPLLQIIKLLGCFEFIKEKYYKFGD